MARPKRRHVVCLSSEGYEASLERGKIYFALIDDEAKRDGFIRVIDESGEDYLYEARRFADIDLPQKIARALATPPG
jgi:hypothetical protein